MVWKKWPRIDKVGLARYVTPSAKYWLPLSVNALDVESGPGGRRLLVESIYSDLLKRGIRYAREEYDPSSQHQIIRNPFEVLVVPRQGTCLDLAILFCGLCLAYELMPILIITDGHAFAAVSLTHGLRDWEAYRPQRGIFAHEPLQTVDPLQDWIGNERRFLAIECTGFAHSVVLSQVDGEVPPEAQHRDNGFLPFDRAIEAGRKQFGYVSRPFRFALDIAVAHYDWGVEPYHFSDIDRTWGDDLQGPKLSRPALPDGGQFFLGRQNELALLDRCWDFMRSERADVAKVNLVAICGQGGEGKTSLVRQWRARMIADRWRSATHVFEWSFYAQGTGGQRPADSDSFFAEAKRFFASGDHSLAGWAKGEYFAGLVGKSRTLLVLDGLEPLQDALTGIIMDDAVRGLLLTLASWNRGLCVVTSRQALTQLAELQGTSCIFHTLDRLDDVAGIALLRRFGVKGRDDELRDVVDAEFKGHALAINLLGNYLRAATDDRDIRRWRDLRLLDQDRREGGHAQRVLLAYERWLAGAERSVTTEEPNGIKRCDDNGTLLQRENEGGCCLAVLRLLGLFERPADASSLLALRAEPVIAELTNALVLLPEADWNRALTRLEDLRLISRVRELASADPVSPTEIDCHPVVREYFSEQLRIRQPAAWRSAHSRLYEHLRDKTPRLPNTTEGLLPLYYATIHACHAGRAQEALEDVYIPRIKRGLDGYFSTRDLGLFSAELSVLYYYFSTPWTRALDSLAEPYRAWVYHEAGYDLQAQGRLLESLQPLTEAVSAHRSLQNWRMATRCAGDLSAVHLYLGRISEAIESAAESVILADHSGDLFQKSTKRCVLAHALHQAGDERQAAKLFAEAEAIQTHADADRPLLYSLRRYQFSCLLLSPVERTTLINEHPAMLAKFSDGSRESDGRDAAMSTVAAIERCDDVCARTHATLMWIKDAGGILNVALGHLSIGHAEMLKARLLKTVGGDVTSLLESSLVHLNKAVSGLERGSTTVDLPRGLMIRADLYATTEDWRRALADVKLAESIAERNRMQLYLADLHLLQAFWACRRSNYVGTSATYSEFLSHKAAAEKLVRTCNYIRRQSFEVAILQPLGEEIRD